MVHSGYLRETSWVNLSKLSLDQEGKPVPWITILAIGFLDAKAVNHLRIFEYGSGNSTIY